MPHFLTDSANFVLRWFVSFGTALTVFEPDDERQMNIIKKVNLSL